MELVRKVEELEKKLLNRNGVSASSDLKAHLEDLVKKHQLDQHGSDNTGTVSWIPFRSNMFQVVLRFQSGCRIYRGLCREVYNRQPFLCLVAWVQPRITSPIVLSHLETSIGSRILCYNKTTDCSWEQAYVLCHKKWWGRRQYCGSGNRSHSVNRQGCTQAFWYHYIFGDSVICVFFLAL